MVYLIHFRVFARLLDFDGFFPNRIAELKLSFEEEVLKNSSVILELAYKDLEAKAMTFINLTTVLSRIVLMNDKYLEYFYDNIPTLIHSCKENIGMIRKNSALLLARLSKSEKNREFIRSLHGIEILQSIAKYIS